MSQQLIEYNNTLIERKSLEQQLIEMPIRASSINLASDIFTNDYGIQAFLLTDHEPENSRGYYLNGDYGYEMSKKFWETSFGNGHGVDNLRAKCKNVIIPGTFKLVRYIIMPERINDFFVSDKYLGEPMIEKIIAEGTIPNDWRDPNNWEEDKFPFNRLIEPGKNDEYKRLIESISPELKWKEEMYPGRHHRAWQSFHLFQDYQTIINVGKESLITALVRFDQFLERTDTKEKLHDQKRNLQGEAKKFKLEYLQEN